MVEVQGNNPLKIVRLTVNNILGVRAVDITPCGNVVRIEGKNGQGKSSVINSIWIAICGASETPVDPVHHGEKVGEITVDLGDIIVTRKFRGGNMYLDVRSPNGLKYPSPQKVLDSLLSKVAYDPQSFIEMKPRERREILLELTGEKEQIEEIESRRGEYYSERTAVGRTLAILKGKVADIPEDDPGEEISITGLVEEMRVAEEADRETEQKRRDADKLLTDAEHITNRTEQKEVRIKELEAQISDIKSEIENNRLLHQEILDRHTTLLAEIEAAPESQVEIIRNKMTEAETHNQVVRTYKAMLEDKAECDKTEKRHADLTAEIEKCDEQKKAILTQSALPIPDISFDDDTLLIGDTPFDDLSTSEKIRASLKIGISQKPRLQVLRIARGSELDSDSMKQVEQLAQEMDVQVWIECVEDEPQDGFWIEDGEIKIMPEELVEA